VLSISHDGLPITRGAPGAGSGIFGGARGFRCRRARRGESSRGPGPSLLRCQPDADLRRRVRCACLVRGRRRGMLTPRPEFAQRGNLSGLRSRARRHSGSRRAATFAAKLLQNRPFLAGRLRSRGALLTRASTRTSRISAGPRSPRRAFESVSSRPAVRGAHEARTRSKPCCSRTARRRSVFSAAALATGELTSLLAVEPELAR